MVATSFSTLDVTLALLPNTFTPKFALWVLPEYDSTGFRTEFKYNGYWQATLRNNFAGRVYDRYWGTLCEELNMTESVDSWIAHPC